MVKSKKCKKKMLKNNCARSTAKTRHILDPIFISNAHYTISNMQKMPNLKKNENFIFFQAIFISGPTKKSTKSLNNYTPK